MKFGCLKILSFLLLSAMASGATLSEGPWKAELEDRTGRFLLFYRGMPVNQKDIPITSFASLQVDRQVYHLGKDVSPRRVEKKENSITVIYSVNPQLAVEVILSFKPHPLVYDETGLSVTYRIDSRSEIPRNTVFRFVFDSFIAEDKAQGYYIPEALDKEITLERREASPSVIFHPFFIHAHTRPSFTFLTSWQRMEEEFMPAEKKMLNFRDIRSGTWDPAVGYFYQLGSISRNLNSLEFFVGLWQKPDRDYPRIKAYYPKEALFSGDEVEIPVLIENSGDFDIDFIKIFLSSPGLRQGSILTLERLSKGEKREILLKDRLSDLSLAVLEGSLKAQLWRQEKIYEQGFALNLPLKKAPEAKKEEGQKTEPQQKIEAPRVLGIPEITRILEKINLLLYFVNRGMESGMSEEMVSQIRKEVLELENRSASKTR